MSTQNLNVSGADALLIDNSTPYFQHMGYARSSNFQFKLKQLDPQNVPKFGATTTFKIQKQDHLLGNVDLRLRLKLPDASTIGAVQHFFTNKVGYAMIDRVRFLVGSNLIQEIEGEWLDVENKLYRNSEQQYVDIIGDARKRAELKKSPLKFTADQVLSFEGATTVDAPRQIYQAPTDEYFGSIEPVMPKTNAKSTVQGRACTAPWITDSPGTVETSYPEVLPDIPAMPAFTGAKHVVHQHDTIAAHVNDAADPDADWGSQFYGNPQYLDLTVPLGLFFSKHPSMYLPIMAIASSQHITIEVRLRDIASLLQHWHVAGSAAGAGTNVSNDAAYKLLTAPVASSKATYWPSAFPEIEHMQLWCHHIQLSTHEAEALQLKPQHVRLVKQVQTLANTLVTMPASGSATHSEKKDFKIELAFLHPVQTIWVVVRDPDDIANNEYFRYLGKPDDDCRITAGDITINGSNRMTEKVEADYTLQRLIPLFHQHQKRSYGVDVHSPIFSIDFALNGQSHNPSGHINMAKWATQQLKLDFKGLQGKTYRIDVYAVALN
jgi:hypothetical protein